ncbi:PIN domain-containing protein [Piscinibacter sp.]|uniref:PIN domain-containing protein n=1 Tax=Piscinibacter sp. TaxID=1903157 RepID=UPI002C527DC8|nr:PIN domain-containing protein [Albitalea sp.]HUG24554.1 PIN domain-containing protein [Albitalea sp.]
MSAFFDTNVVVYGFDRGAPLKQEQALALLSDHMSAGTAVFSTQVLQETYVTLTRKQALAPADALEVVRALSQERIIGSSAEFVVRALTLSQKRRLSAWDALVIQAALDAGCTTLYSEDLQHGVRIDELRIVNPFALEAHESPATPRSARAQR